MEQENNPLSCKYRRQNPISVRDELISTMIVKCGINPESLIRRVEEGGEQVKYEIGGIYISRHKNILSVGVKHSSISNHLIWYQWRL